MIFFINFCNCGLSHVQNWSLFDKNYSNKAHLTANSPSFPTLFEKPSQLNFSLNYSFLRQACFKHDFCNWTHNFHR